MRDDAFRRLERSSGFLIVSGTLAFIAVLFIGYRFWTHQVAIESSNATATRDLAAVRAFDLAIGLVDAQTSSLDTARKTLAKPLDPKGGVAALARWRDRGLELSKAILAMKGVSAQILRVLPAPSPAISQDLAALSNAVDGDRNPLGELDADLRALAQDPSLAMNMTEDDGRRIGRGYRDAVSAVMEASNTLETELQRRDNTAERQFRADEAHTVGLLAQSWVSVLLGR